MTMPTLLDVAKINGSDDIAGLIDEASKYTPEVGSGYARTIKGINYKTLVRTALPTARFRDYNDGADATKGRYENRLVETYVLNPRWECDKAVADAHEDGAEAFIALEAEAILQASMLTLGRQFYYGRGTNGDGKGHPGLIDGYDATNMVVDAGGSTDDTATSVWAVKWGPKDVGWVLGKDGNINVDPVRIADIVGQNNKKLTGYVQELLAYVGVQVGSTRCVGRIKKITEDSTKTLTDKLISKLLGKFPANVVPDALYMSRRSLNQLQESRTATNPTGAPAPFPTEAFGIPIVVTESILNTEKLAS